MTTLFHFLNLNGYGIYVWPSYGLAAALLGLQLFLPWKRWRRLNPKQKGAHAQTQ
jgi:heme exporter protein CcmD